MAAKYIEKRKNDFIVRKFLKTIGEMELEWHVDEYDRILVPIQNSGWKLQFENKLPIDLEEGKHYFIPKETWHRVIKGTKNLTILIKENKGDNEKFMDRSSTGTS